MCVLCVAEMKDGIAVTEAGRLSCHYVIHVNASTNLSAWKDIMKKALKEAESRSIGSISFPVLGTGILNSKQH